MRPIIGYFLLLSLIPLLSPYSSRLTPFYLLTTFSLYIPASYLLFPILLSNPSLLRSLLSPSFSPLSLETLLSPTLTPDSSSLSFLSPPHSPLPPFSHPSPSSPPSLLIPLPSLSPYSSLISSYLPLSRPHRRSFLSQLSSASSPSSLGLLPFPIALVISPQRPLLPLLSSPTALPRT